MEEFINHLASQFTNQAPSKLNPGTFLYDIDGYSSLESLFILLMIDEIYNVNITSDDLTESTTIEDLYNIIKSRR